MGGPTELSGSPTGSVPSAEHGRSDDSANGTKPQAHGVGLRVLAHAVVTERARCGPVPSPDSDGANRGPPASRSRRAARAGSASVTDREEGRPRGECDVPMANASTPGVPSYMARMALADGRGFVEGNSLASMFVATGRRAMRKRGACVEWSGHAGASPIDPPLELAPGPRLAAGLKNEYRTILRGTQRCRAPLVQEPALTQPDSFIPASDPRLCLTVP